MLPVRAWELLAGSVLAFLALSGRGGAGGPNRLHDAASVLGLGLIAFAVATFSAETAFPGYAAVAPVLGAATLIWAGPRSAVGRLLSLRPVVFVGLISYSLYLWHWPLIAFHKLVFPDGGSAGHALGLLVASLALATLSWRFVETPFRGTGRVFATRAGALGASAAALAMVVVAALLFPQLARSTLRAPAEALAAADVSREKAESDGRCLPQEELTVLRGRVRGFCEVGVEGEGPRKVLIWGDSHVGAWFPALDRSLKDAGIAGLAITLAGCPVAFDLARAETDKEGCVEATSALRDYLATHDVDRLILVGSWFGVIEDKNTVYDGQRSFDEASRIANVTRAIAATGDALHDMGIATSFLLTSPGARHSVPEATFRREVLGFYPEIRRSTAEYQAELGPILAAAEAHFDQVIRVDDLLCPDEFCDVERGGQLLYYDGNHPSRALNDLAYPRLSEQIGAFLSLN